MASKQEKERYHHGDLRRSLVAAALELVNERGVHALSVREAAQRAGVSPGAPYRHFANKESLLAAIATDGYRDLAVLIEAAGATHPADPLSALTFMARGYLEFAHAQPARFRLMYGGFFPQPEHYPELLAACEEAMTAFAGSLASWQQQGAIRAGSVSELTEAVHGFIHGLATLGAEGHLEIPRGDALLPWLKSRLSWLWLGLSSGA